jgi:hypothetical protein
VDNDKPFVSAEEMLIELREDNLKLVEALRQAKDVVDAAKDNATSGILDEWTDLAEERALVPVRKQPQGLIRHQALPPPGGRVGRGAGLDAALALTLPRRCAPRAPPPPGGRGLVVAGGRAV